MGWGYIPLKGEGKGVIIGGEGRGDKPLSHPLDFFFFNDQGFLFLFLTFECYYRKLQHRAV